jgi:polyhydroxyalkanoate synthesis regulator phasin
MDSVTMLLPLAGPLLGGGLLFGLMKLRPERDALIVTSAKTTVELAFQAQALMASELREARAEVEKLERMVIQLTAEVVRLRRDVADELTAEVVALRQDVADVQERAA